METAVATTPQPSDLPPDCQHLDWEVGCPRCFAEMKGLARGNIAATTADAQMEGAILMNWHVLMVVADMEMQLAPLTQSLELDKVRLAKELCANLKALRVYLLGLGSTPHKMEAALRKAAEIATQVQQLQKEAGAAAEESPIILTDKGAA